MKKIVCLSITVLLTIHSFVHAQKLEFEIAKSLGTANQNKLKSPIYEARRGGNTFDGVDLHVGLRLLTLKDNSSLTIGTGYRTMESRSFMSSEYDLVQLAVSQSFIPVSLTFSKNLPENYSLSLRSGYLFNVYHDQRINPSWIGPISSTDEYFFMDLTFRKMLGRIGFNGGVSSNFPLAANTMMPSCVGLKFGIILAIWQGKS